MEAAAACCAGLRKNFGGHIALPIRTRNTNARSLIKTPNAHESEHTTATSRSRYFKSSGRSSYRKLTNLPPHQQSDEHLKTMCKSEHRRTCSKVCGKKGANSRRGFLCEMWGFRIDIEFSASSAEPSLVELRSTGQPRA